MNKITLLALGALLILKVQITSAQKTGYIETDSTANFGVNLIDGTSRDNAKYVLLINDDEDTIKYTPKDLKKYGFKNGASYESRSILLAGDREKVFLEVLAEGKMTLYHYVNRYKKAYFLERDSSGLVEISKDNFENKLVEMASDINQNTKQTKLTSYNKKSLTRVVDIYNNGNDMPLPYIRFGLTAGFSITSLPKPPSTDGGQGLFTSFNSLGYHNAISFSPSSNVSFGAFADLPIDKYYLSLNTSVIFTSSSFSASYRGEDFGSEVFINNTAINVPVLLRYTMPTLGLRAFANGGVIYSYQSKNDIQIYRYPLFTGTATKSDYLVEGDPIIPNHMLGLSIGLGIQRNVTYRHVVSAEFRFNHFPGSETTLMKNQVDFLLGYSF